VHEAEKLSLEAIGRFVESEDRKQVYSDAGPIAALYGEDDRFEPGAGYAADRPLRNDRPGAANHVSTAPFP
jgi:hypothetical protein